MALTNKVIFINDVKQEDEMPVEFTHQLMSNSGWRDTFNFPNDEKIVSITYLGKCRIDGDMFSVKWATGGISVFKGHLNSGKY